MPPSEPFDSNAGPRRRTTEILSEAPPEEAAPGEGRRPVLVVVQGEEIGRRYLLNERRLVIGREPGRADLTVPDPSVSAAHARLEVDPDTEAGGAVVDLGSRNGTWRNGEAVERAALVDGDKLRLGATVLKFTFHDAIEEGFHGELDRLVNRDELSGLFARRYFEREWPRAFARAREEGRSLSLAVLDMDGLKPVNDRYGHQAGSACIAEVGERIGRALPGEAKAARFGGDEFVVWLPEHDGEAGEDAAEAIRRAVARAPIEGPIWVVRPTVSIGVAELEPGVAGPQELLRLADEALYRAKKRGRNAVSR